MDERWLQSSAYPISILMIDSTDHIKGKPGLLSQLTVTISKNGGSFLSALGTLGEMGHGWYSLAGASGDRDTLGELAVHAEAPGADPYDCRYVIVPWDPFNAMNLGLGSLPAVAASGAGGLPTVGTGSGQIALAGGSVNLQADQSGVTIGALNHLATTAQVEVASAVWDARRLDHVTAGTFGEGVLVAGPVSVSPGETRVLDSGVLASGSATSVGFASSAVQIDGYYVGASVKLISGTGAGQSTRRVVQYQGSTRQATLDRPWSVVPASGTGYATLDDGGPALDGSLRVVASGVSGNVSGSVASVVGAVGGVTGVVFPANFGALVVTSGGGVVASQVLDKAGYKLTLAEYQNIADVSLTRDWGSVALVPAHRSSLNALRVLRNKTTTASGQLLVYSEDDVTQAWVGGLETDPRAVPITGIDPTS